MDRLIRYTEDHLEQLRGKYICAANVHTTVMAYENKTYQQVYDNAALIIPDGGPLSSIGRRRGYKDMRRTPGPDYMEAMLKRGGSHFFYGSTFSTLEKMRERIESQYPEARIAGMISPPFRKLTADEDKEIIQQINEAGPDYIWVGLGAPKQEMWMYRHKDRVNGLMVGVGAAFDYMAGNIKRAPMWMQSMNLEWVFRIMQEPRRLTGRYLTTNTKFFWNVVVMGR